MTDLFFDELIRVSALESFCSQSHWLFIHPHNRRFWCSLKQANSTQVKLWFEI